jgi:hypothetical protein
MSDGRKRAPGEAWAALEKEALREEGERVAKMSDAELDASLKERGIDAKAARERGAALAAKLMAQRSAAPAAPPAAAPAPAPGPAKVVSLAAEREKRGRSVAWITLVAAAAAVAVIGGGAGVYVALNSPEPAPTQSIPVPTQSGPPAPPSEVLAKQEADALRGQAVAECASQDWHGCRSDLRRAGKLDPAGNAARPIARLEGKAERAISEEGLDAKPAPYRPRSLSAEESKDFVAALAKEPSQVVRLACAPDAEPQQLCAQLAGALKKAGWTVTRPRLKAPVEVGGEVVHRVLVQVTTDADDATQDAADVLADALEGGALLRTRGPDDAPADAEAPLTLVVGPQ